MSQVISEVAIAQRKWRLHILVFPGTRSVIKVETDELLEGCCKLFEKVKSFKPEHSFSWYGLKLCFAVSFSPVLHFNLSGHK